MKTTPLLTLPLLTLSLPFLPIPANATVQIAILNQGQQTLVASGQHNAAFSGPFNNWDFNNISVSDLTDLLNSTNLNASTDNPGTIEIIVTTTDHQPGFYQNITIGFTDNLHPQNWTINETAFWDPQNQPFAKTIQLGHATFHDIGVETQNIQLNADNPFSLTATYRITAPTPGTDLSTMKISRQPLPIPEPDPNLIVLLGAATATILHQRRKARQR